MNLRKETVRNLNKSLLAEVNGGDTYTISRIHCTAQCTGYVLHETEEEP